MRLLQRETRAVPAAERERERPAPTAQLAAALAGLSGVFS